TRPDERQSFLRRKLPFLIKPLVNGELVPFAKKSLNGVRCQMAMAGADVHDQRIRRSRALGQRFAKPLIHRLPNEMFDYGSVRHWLGGNHIERIMAECERMSN